MTSDTGSPGPAPSARPRAPVVYSPEYECDIGPHVFPTRKYRLVLERMIEDGDITASEVLAPPAPTRGQLERVHTPEYLRDLAELRDSPGTRMSELPLTREIVHAYALACGGTLRAAREALRAGAAVHLGGGFHHAYPDHAEGFCYLNDLAVAIRVLQGEGAIRRAAVVDLDVHQGNGTASIFARDPEVFTLSMHQEQLYPVPKEHSSLDVGLEVGTGDREYLARLDEALPQVWAHAPELVLYQAGADPYVGDMLGALALTLDGLAARDTRVLEGCAARGIPVVVTLGGGYAREVGDTVRIHHRTARIAMELATRTRV